MHGRRMRLLFQQKDARQWLGFADDTRRRRVAKTGKPRWLTAALRGPDDGWCFVNNGRSKRNLQRHVTRFQRYEQLNREAATYGLASMQRTKGWARGDNGQRKVRICRLGRRLAKKKKKKGMEGVD